MKEMISNSLSSLNSGKSAAIKKIGQELQGPERRRLLDLGIVPGAKITHRLDGPSNNPRAFEIFGTVIALRKEQTDHIYISPNGYR